MMVFNTRDIYDMNQLQWFPGHMKKTLEKIQTHLIYIDVVVIILDARIPFSSMNWQLLSIIQNKPCVVLFTKTSLSDVKHKNFVFDYYQKKGLSVLEIDAKTGLNISKIYPQALTALSLVRQSTNNRFRKPFLVKPLKLMIVGVPNVGKSTLINKLAQKKVVKVANIVGVTRHFQWININDELRLLDTPGVLYSKFTIEKIGLSLAVLGYMNDAILPLEKVIKYVLCYLQKYYRHYLTLHFDLSSTEAQQDNLLEIILTKNQHLLICKNIDIINIYQMLLHKIRNKCLQKINLDLDFSF